MKLDIDTVLKLAKLAAEKCALTSTQPGFVTEQRGRKIKVRFSDLAAALEDLAAKDLVAVHRCKDCNNWSKAPRADLGACFPKDHGCSRAGSDFCSRNYEPRSEGRRDVDERVARLLSEE